MSRPSRPCAVGPGSRCGWTPTKAGRIRKRRCAKSTGWKRWAWSSSSSPCPPKCWRRRAGCAAGCTSRSSPTKPASTPVTFRSCGSASMAIGERVLHPHAAMAVGALFLCEQILVRRVVLVDQELVGEVEADAAERIAGARRLRDVDGAVRVLRQLQADAIERLRVLLQRRQIFVLD